MGRQYAFYGASVSSGTSTQKRPYITPRYDYSLSLPGIDYGWCPPISLPATAPTISVAVCTPVSGQDVHPDTEKEFERLANVWKQQTGHLSNISTRCTHPAYQQIIGMGKTAILFILRDLKDTQEDWFWALTAITGENPIPKRDAGYVDKMTEAWLRWAKAKGYDV